MVSKIKFGIQLLAAIAIFAFDCPVYAGNWKELMQQRSVSAARSISKSLAEGEAEIIEQGVKLHDALEHDETLSNEDREVGVRFLAANIGVAIGDTRIRVDHLTVIASDRAIDMERMDYPRVEHTAIEDGGYYIFTGAPELTNLTIFGTSRGRMRYGIAAIGVDGAPMEVCRLWARNKELAYEITGSDRSRIETVMALGRGRLDCLDEQELGPYWEKRYAAFLSQRGDEIAY